jgi:hypothetical protein
MNPQLKAILVALIHKAGGLVIVTPEEIAESTARFGGPDGVEIMIEALSNASGPVALQAMLMPRQDRPEA